MRSGLVIMHGTPVGRIWEDEHGFHFLHEKDWVETVDAEPVSTVF
jgi:hypothetical protein